MAYLPTEAIGSIPRTAALIQAQRAYDAGALDAQALERVADDAVRETLAAFEATGSPIISDGEQRKFHNFATYPAEGQPNFDLQDATSTRFLPPSFAA
jgi:5-methyltetrahydropteroyltriglutamate--homocysteine methyltransferase